MVKGWLFCGRKKNRNFLPNPERRSKKSDATLLLSSISLQSVLLHLSREMERDGANKRKEARVRETRERERESRERELLFSLASSFSFFQEHRFFLSFFLSFVLQVFPFERRRAAARKVQRKVMNGKNDFLLRVGRLFISLFSFLAAAFSRFFFFLGCLFSRALSLSSLSRVFLSLCCFSLSQTLSLNCKK